MKLIPILILYLFFSQMASGQETPTPEGYTIVDSVYGDLDNDGIAELAVAYNTRNSRNEDIPRELVIYKLREGNWILWKKSRQALLSSQGGGMMGDPYGKMEIVKGSLHIHQDGGSSWKWWTLDKYAFRNNDLYLVGYSLNYGKLCEYWLNVDFNLSTGKMMVKKEFERCDNQQQITHKLQNETLYRKDVKITFEHRHENDIITVTPKYKHEIYIATKRE